MNIEQLFEDLKQEIDYEMTRVMRKVEERLGKIEDGIYKMLNEYVSGMEMNMDKLREDVCDIISGRDAEW